MKTPKATIANDVAPTTQRGQPEDHLPSVVIVNQKTRAAEKYLMDARG
jgi:hypothetical protein